MLDVGTGSGVLAVAASLLGARTVTAIDEDADAVDAARDTLRRNGLDARIDVHQADLAGFDSRGCDVVVANLTSALLIRLAADLTRRVLPGGQLVVGGFTEDQRADVRAAFSQWGDIDARATEAGWVALTLVVRDARSDCSRTLTTDC